MTKPKNPAAKLKDRRSGGKTVPQFRWDNNISDRSWQRMRQQGTTPRLTWVNSRFRW